MSRSRSGCDKGGSKDTETFRATVRPRLVTKNLSGSPAPSGGRASAVIIGRFALTSIALDWRIDPRARTAVTSAVTSRPKLEAALTRSTVHQPRISEKFKCPSYLIIACSVSGCLLILSYGQGFGSEIQSVVPVAFSNLATVLESGHMSPWRTLVSAALATPAHRHTSACDNPAPVCASTSEA